ncbi:MAG: radical SAM/SPASM domain-containing protein [Candidatus Sulfotelmatobacter sp.]
MSTVDRTIPTLPVRPFRLDVPLHDLLQHRGENSVSAAAKEPVLLPTPVFPQHPELIHEIDAADIAAHQEVLQTGKRHWPASRILKTMRGWMTPYFKSRILPGDFQPIIAYLFVEWKCNLDCHYCWSYDNRVKGMTGDTARRAIDWLESTPCRVLAPTGGEPLLRPDFVHKVINYAAKKDFWIYLATNARLLRPAVTDRLADAGIATINFAVDTVKEKAGLPKNLQSVRSNFDYLLKRQYRYGYTVFFNTNICRTNIEDVKQLVEIAHDNGISITFHINEAPMMEQHHFKHLDQNDTYIRPDGFSAVDDLLDWLIDKQRQGYKMVDSIPRLQKMKWFMRGGGERWGCRAGKNWLIIRTDGSLAPCFPMYNEKYDWGSIENQKFDRTQLTKMKEGCEPHCFSTLGYNVAYCYETTRVMKWLFKQALNRFQGATGSFE